MRCNGRRTGGGERGERGRRGREGVGEEEGADLTGEWVWVVEVVSVGHVGGVVIAE